MGNNSSKRTFALIIGYGFAGIILFGLLSVVIGIGDFTSSKRTTSQTTGVSFDDFESIKSIDISGFSGELKIIEGNVIKVEGKNLPNNFNCVPNGDTLEIIGGVSANYWATRIGKWNYPELTITLPSDFKGKDVNISFGAGRLHASRIAAETFNIDTGAGEVKIDELITQKADLNCGAGEIEINGGSLRDCTINNGVGSIDIKAQLLGECEVVNGIGDADIEILGNIDDYYIVTDNAIGEIEIDGKKYGDGSIGDSNAKNRISLTNNIGDVDVEFKR